MRFTLKKPSILPSLLTACSVAILGGLGTWQAQKYITKSEGRSGVCAQETLLHKHAGFLDFSADPLAACPNKVVLEGTLLPEPIIPVGPRVHEGEGGYHLYAPLKAAGDESIILVNLGWSKDKTLSADDINTLNTSIKITGSLITPSGKGRFTLDNNPSANEWFSIQPQEIAAIFNLEQLSSQTFYAGTIEPPLEANFIPAQLSKLYLTPETHLQYAAFWYCMAFALLIIFTLRFALDRESSDKEPLPEKK